MANEQVLNWFSKSPRMTAGLRRRVASRNPKSLVTIRLGDKWYNLLRGDNRVAISISDDPAKPKIIGHARVKAVYLLAICHLPDSLLRANIGAKRRHNVLRDMRKVYGKDKVTGSSLVSVMELVPIPQKP